MGSPGCATAERGEVSHNLLRRGPEGPLVELSGLHDSVLPHRAAVHEYALHAAPRRAYPAAAVLPRAEEPAAPLRPARPRQRRRLWGEDGRREAREWYGGEIDVGLGTVVVVGEDEFAGGRATGEVLLEGLVEEGPERGDARRDYDDVCFDAG